MYNFCKRLIDIVFSVLVIILISPYLALIAIIMKIESKGPVFYKQTRIGKNGIPFQIYKFRTMKLEIDELSQRKYLRKALEKDINKNRVDIYHSVKNDPRVTIVGKFLRKYSLDEFPQFINILNGTMSLVGPRPALPFEYNNYKFHEKKRLSVKPGFTGLWQIQGRSEATFDQMINIDIDYIDKKSILLDMKIILITIYRVILGGRGAY